MSTSIVIPAYNAGSTLAAAIESALIQDVDDLEVVVVDDGSTDDTASIADAFGAPVRCVRTPNEGVSAARNTGISISLGRYVAFLDSDDVWLPGKLKVQLEALEAHPEAGASFTGAIRVDQNLCVLEEIEPCLDVDLTRALLFGCVVSGSASSVVLRREVLERVEPFDTKLSQCADWDMWLRLSVATKFVAVPEAFVMYRTHPGSMSSNVGLLERDSLAMLDKFFANRTAIPYVDLRREAMAHNWIVLAGSYLHSGRRRDAVRCLVRAGTSHPRSLGYAVALPARQWRRHP